MSMLVALLSLPASAFAPSDTVYIGIEPQRIEWRHPHEQARLSRASEPLARFQAEEGAGWVVRWDETTRTPREAMGPGIPVPSGSSDEVTAALRSFLVARADLFGFDPAQLVDGQASWDDGSDTWYVDFGVEREVGVPTYRGGISLRVKFGNLIYVRSATAPGAPVVGSWGLDLAKAQAMAVSTGPAPAAVHTETSAEPMLLERWTDGGLVLRRVIATRSRTTEPPGIWVSFVDAENGELLSVHNEVRFVNGTITGRVHSTSPQSGLVTVPMPLVRVQGSSNTFTDEQGRFTMNSGPFSSNLDGSYLEVVNAGGGEGELNSSSANMEWDATDATQAELDTYVFAHEAREWAEDVASTNSMVTRAQRANVNLNQTCNAFFDGNSINFFRSGGGCTNTGENDDVIHHEWGHGFHLYQIRTGTFDGSLSEGAADSVAFFQSGDNLIGPGFFNNGGAIRDVEPNREYPDDFRNSQYAVHDNGLIFGGAMWDLWGELVATEGENRGTQSAIEVFAGLLRGGPTIPESYGEALVADDDDGNLGNGTPHACQIDAAFAEHGLSQGAGGGSSGNIAIHEPPEFLAPDETFQLQFELPAASDCFSGVAESAVVHYRRGTNEWKEIEGRIDGGTVRAALPGFADGTFVEYWMEGEDIEENSFQSPSSGRIAPFTVYAGKVLQVSCEKLGSDNDGGFKTKVLSGDGDDPWRFAAPQGEGGDAPAAFSGERVWGTVTSDDGLYPPGQTSRLRAGPFPTFHYEGVFLQYRRWLTVEDQLFDGASVEVNGARVWKNGGTSEGTGHTTDDVWMSHAVDLRGDADRGEAVLDFVLEADDGVEFGGWNIDDVCLYAPDTFDNHFGIGDLVADTSTAGVVVLTWTNPRHDDAARVVLVKRADQFPDSFDDGFVIADLTNVEAGSLGSAVDSIVEDDNYYAVYASDGTTWTSYTVEGLNAVQFDRDFDDGGFQGFERVEQVVESCGCDHGSAGSAPLWLAAVGGLFALRRRSR